MKFFVSAASAAALFAALASASNTLLTPKQNEVVKSGTPYLIKWEPDTEGPVQINLKKGNSKNLDDMGRVVLLEYNWGNYTWDVPASLENGKDYAFSITWGKNPGPDDINYTYLFEINDGKGDSYESSTTESASATETETATTTETESATETTDAATETETATEAETEPTTTKSSSNSTETEVPSGSNTTTKVTKTPTGPTSTPDAKDEDSSAGVFGASVSMALAVAVAAAALL